MCTTAGPSAAQSPDDAFLRGKDRSVQSHEGLLLCCTAHTENKCRTMILLGTVDEDACDFDEQCAAFEIHPSVGTAPQPDALGTPFSNVQVLAQLSLIQCCFRARTESGEARSM